MKNFRKAIHDSLHHWPAIVLATICSLGVATLWGANIGALLPVVEMTLKGDSTQTWIQKAINGYQLDLDRVAEEIQQAKPEGAKPEPVDGIEGHSIGWLESRSKELKSKIAWSTWLLGWANVLLPPRPFETVCLIMVVLVLSTLVKHLLMLASDMIIGRVSTDIVRSLRGRIFDQALAMDRRTYQTYGTSGVLATITHTSESLSIGLLNFFGAAVREPLRISSCLLFASLICWRLLFLSLILAPALVFVIAWSNRKIKSIAKSILDRNGGLHEVILESLSNIFTVQAYTMEDEERKRFAESTKTMQNASLRLTFYTGLSRPFMELVGIGMIGITVCAGSYIVLNQQTHIGFIKICEEPLQISSMLLFFGFLIGASDPLRKLSGVSTAILTGAMAADALYGMLERPIVVTEKAETAKIASPHSSLAIENVSFSYEAGCPVLDSVQLEIPFGKTIAILGANGSGKSTLIQLLCRFYDPSDGRIMMDGQDYRDLSIQDIRNRIALVSQTTELFNRTVLENIRYGSPKATIEEVIHAAKLAHAHNFIEQSLANGYETNVGQSGQKLSGGQRQRIALARAILRKPEILILDESTSQIDMASELQIRETLQELKGRFTTIIITHREALCALADDIYCMEGGILRPISETANQAA